MQYMLEGILLYLYILEEYNNNKQKLKELETEYQYILIKLDKLEQEGIIGAFDKRTIIELSNDVVKELTKKYKNVQKGIGDSMGRALMETEARVVVENKA